MSKFMPEFYKDDPKIIGKYRFPDGSEIKIPETPELHAALSSLSDVDSALRLVGIAQRALVVAHGVTPKQLRKGFKLQGRRVEFWTTPEIGRLEQSFNQIEDEKKKFVASMVFTELISKAALIKAAEIDPGLVAAFAKTNTTG